MLSYLAQQPYPSQVLVVDDGSHDRTAQVVESLAQAHPALQLLRNPHRGKGYAVKTGMLAARGQFRFLCDADLSMPIEQLERFLPPRLADCDIALGSREVPGARRIGEPLSRHLLGRAFNLLVRALALRRLRDTQCGFKCFREEAVRGLFPLQRLSGFGFDVEILFLAQKKGMRLAEVPIDWYYHQESKVKPLRHGLALLVELLALRWNYFRGRY